MTPVNFSAEFVNAAQLDARFARALSLLDAMGGVAGDISRIVTEAVRDEAPLGLTGALKGGIDWRLLYLSNAMFESEVTSSAFYTKWVLDGRGEVRPIRASVLHWVDKSGADVFSMYSRATDPNPFHIRGWNRAKPAVKQRWQDYAHSVVGAMVL